MAVHETGSSPGVLAAGPMATLDHIPPGHSFSTLLVIGHGPNSTLYDWGTRLLANSGKARLGPEKSFVLSHLGYWVDNGAPYYHSTMGYNISEHMGCLAHGVRNCKYVNSYHSSFPNTREQPFSRESLRTFLNLCTCYLTRSIDVTPPRVRHARGRSEGGSVCRGR